MSATQRSCVAIFVFSLGVTDAAAAPPGAQGTDDAVVSAVREMEATAGSGVRVRRSPVTGLATFVAVEGGAGIPVPDGGTPEARAIAFIDAYGGAFGLPDGAHVTHERTVASDSVGMDHVRLRQTVRGVPVVGGEIMVHLRGAVVVASNGWTLPDVDGLDVTPALEAKQVETGIRRFLEKHLEVADATLGTPRLEILNKGIFDGARRPTRLTWFVEATGPTLREFVWVDARTGAIVLHFSQPPDARGRLIRTAKSTIDLPGSLMGAEGSPPTDNADAVGGNSFTGDTYDYFVTEHGRDSYNGTLMAHGESHSRADDLDAHELTHAVTELSANLYCYMGPGALNESFSDIFGETVDQWNTPLGGIARRGSDTAAVKWLMGEDVPGAGAVRNMMTPAAFGDPGKMGPITPTP
jgi:bacillolysin